IGPSWRGGPPRGTGEPGAPTAIRVEGPDAAHPAARVGRAGAPPYEIPLVRIEGGEVTLNQDGVEKRVLLPASWIGRRRTTGGVFQLLSGNPIRDGAGPQ